MGVTRRMRVFDDPSLQIWFAVAAFGAALIACGIAAFFAQIAVSIRDRVKNRDLTGDPWGGRTLEWATASPPAEYNFAFNPVVQDLDAWWHMKTAGAMPPKTGFLAIQMPKNTATGMILAGFATVFGMAMVWYIWWLAALAFASLIAAAIAHTFDENRDFQIAAATVAAVETTRRRLA